MRGRGRYYVPHHKTPNEREPCLLFPRPHLTVRYRVSAQAPGSTPVRGQTCRYDIIAFLMQFGPEITCVKSFTGLDGEAS